MINNSKLIDFDADIVPNVPYTAHKQILPFEDDENLDCVHIELHNIGFELDLGVCEISAVHLDDNITFPTLRAING